MSEASGPLEPRDERDREWLCELLDEPQRAVELAARDHAGFEAGGRCEYLALMALLAETVDPRRPSPGLERRIIAAATGAAASPAPASAPRRPSAGRWLLPLAATLALVAAGLSAWQATRIAELRAAVDRQAGELAAMREIAGRLARMEGENADQAAALALLTGAGVEFCPLRPPAASPTPAAWGALAMSADGSHWYLRVVGLEPRGDRREYRLWFLRDGEPVAGAVLPAGDGALEMLNGAAPERFNAVVITLDPAGADRPTGPRLLFGNERMRLL